MDCQFFRAMKAAPRMPHRQVERVGSADLWVGGNYGEDQADTKALPATGSPHLASELAWDIVRIFDPELRAVEQVAHDREEEPRRWLPTLTPRAAAS